MASTNLQAIRGMNDLLPVGSKSPITDANLYVAIQRLFADWVEAAGYRYIQTPVVEMTELFKRSSGETSDIVSKEMYSFEDQGGRDLSLRPEGSASVCRAVIEHGLAASGSGLRFYYVAPMFRAERPQRGRYRQHIQLGVEIFKEDDASADAEVIAILYKFFTEKLGLDKISVGLNSVGSPACRPAYRDALVGYLRGHEASLSEDSRRRLETNPMRVLDSKAEQDAPIVADAPVLLDYLDADCRDHFGAVQRHLDAVGVPFTIMPRLVRGLDYYTKTAFELTCDTLDGAIKVIGGGGRYDGLVEQLGGPATPAVGFGSGIERVILALESQGKTVAPERAPAVYVAALTPDDKSAALAVAFELRAAGIEAEIGYRDRGLGKQLGAAAKNGARFAVIVGGEEAAKGQVSLKDFTTRDQRPVDRAKLVEALRAAPAANAPMM